MRPPLGSPPATGKLFRFVRACDARYLDVKRNRSEILMRDAFPFSLLAPGGLPFSLLAPEGFPFSLGGSK